MADKALFPISAHQENKSSRRSRRKARKRAVAIIPTDTAIRKYEPPMVYIPESEPINVNIFTCPLSGKLFVEPVVAADGFTYERSYIQDWLSNHNVSPITLEILCSNILISNNIMLPILKYIRQRM